MNIDTDGIRAGLAAAAQFLADNREPLMFGAGAVSVLLAVVLAWRWWRHGEQHTRLGSVALGLATLVAAEGMWELFTGPVDMASHLAVVLFSFLEITMVSQGVLAKRKLNQKAPAMAAARKHMRFMLAIAVISGVLAASAGGHFGNVLLRLIAPAIAAGIWWMELTADQAVDAEPTSWIWTPRRIAVELGWMAPGKGDNLDDVRRDRRVQKMVRAAAAERAGGKRAARAGRRLDRLALRVDAATVQAAREQLGRALTIRAELFADSDTKRDVMAVADAVAPTPADDILDRMVSLADGVEQRISDAVSDTVSQARQARRTTPVRQGVVARSRRMGRPAPQITVILPDTKPARSTAPAAAKKATSAPSRGRPSKAQKVATFAARMPDASVAEIAKKAGVSADTVRRHRAAMQTVNGHDHGTEQ